MHVYDDTATCHDAILQAVQEEMTPPRPARVAASPVLEILPKRLAEYTSVIRTDCSSAGAADLQQRASQLRLLRK